MTVFDIVGNTPLLELRRVYQETRGISIQAKAEFMNPSGSVKDRAVRSILLAAVREGRLREGMTILDATSGSTGIAYCMMGKQLGCKVMLCMPRNVSAERKKIIRAYGGTVIETNPLEGAEGAYRVARQMAAESGDGCFYPDQYANERNWRAHYETTAEEIWRQTGGRVTHFVAGAGTSGTFVGTVRRLKELNPALQAVLVQPDSPFHGLEGLRYLKGSNVKSFFDGSLVDRTVEVATENAWCLVRRLARAEGILVGISSAANLIASIETSYRAADGACIVTIFADGGHRYLSEPVWADLNKEKGGC